MILVQLPFLSRLFPLHPTIQSPAQAVLTTCCRLSACGKLRKPIRINPERISNHPARVNLFDFILPPLYLLRRKPVRSERLALQLLHANNQPARHSCSSLLTPACSMPFAPPDRSLRMRLLQVLLPALTELEDPLLYRIVDRTHPITEDEIAQTIEPNLIQLKT